jgi:pseudouridine synthase
MTQPAEVIVKNKQKNQTLLEITLFEGRNRQVRRMLGALRIELISLKRVAIGNLEIGNLKIGQYRSLSEKEVKGLLV